MNEQFAAAVLEEAQGGPALVFVQDYHFALLAAAAQGRAAGPGGGAVLAHPVAEPGDVPRLPVGDGHRSTGCSATTCSASTPSTTATTSWRPWTGRWSAASTGSGSRSTRGGHETSVRPLPDQRRSRPRRRSTWATDWEDRAAALRKKYRLGDRPLLVGVDRVDYTKGIPERLRGVDRLLQKHPELKGRFHFLQVGAPSRTHLPAYRDLNDEVQDLADRINWEHGTERWQPVVFLNEHHGPEEIYLLYRMAAGCVVSSLHDGMNLVAKEFVAAREDEQRRAGAVAVHRRGAGVDRRGAGQPVRRGRTGRRAACAR